MQRNQENVSFKTDLLLNIGKFIISAGLDLSREFPFPPIMLEYIKFLCRSAVVSTEQSIEVYRFDIIPAYLGIISLQELSQ